MPTTQQVIRDTHPHVGEWRVESVNGPFAEVHTQTIADPALLLKVDEIGLTRRSVNCLLDDDIVYVGDLVQRTPSELLRLRNFGKTSLQQIKEALSMMGLHLGVDLPDWSRPTSDLST